MRGGQVTCCYLISAEQSESRLLPLFTLLPPSLHTPLVWLLYAHPHAGHLMRRGDALSGTGRISHASHASLPNARLARSEAESTDEDEDEDAAATKTLRPPEAGTAPLAVITITGTFWSFQDYLAQNRLPTRSTETSAHIPRLIDHIAKGRGGMRQRLSRSSG
ncbi:hypothetical protein BDZ90DRAFT_143940 [Jaminaea rosea]|uniref:Uncharacterized protein n=1 Tax=Jaminaea rosea TaxID=1569628 RepID=A0A316UYP3_9BASI|nr:hypothetical protein BDZ90DRAFT_143940 [Jaminaea rosea]PWN28265.1 hypothetical protein BDZ90DRAFT_143940 [Jaminaea rosea]